MLKTLGAQVKQYRWVTFITPVFLRWRPWPICSCRC